MKGLYQNKITGARLEAFDTNTDVFGTIYITWRWCDNGLAYNVPIESFKAMLKHNHYELIESYEE